MTSTLIPTFLDPRTSPGAAPASGPLPHGKLTNMAGRRRRQWVPIALPYGVLRTENRDTAFMTDRGLFLRAVRCEDVGTHSTVWRVFAPLAELQSISGTVLDPTPGMPEQAYVNHPWVNDAPQAVIPKLMVRIGGVDHKLEAWSSIELESSSPAHQRWHAKGKVGESGFAAELWVTFAHLSPVADVDCALVWSNPNDQEPAKAVEAIAFLAGEYVAFDFLDLHGVPFVPVHDGVEWLTMWTAGTTQVYDAGGFGVTGRMLCLPQVPTGDLGPEWVDDVETLVAAFVGPVGGLAEPEAWGGRWLAHRNVPRVSRAGFISPEQQAKLTLDAFFADREPRGWYARRPIGCSPTPSQTGGQEDFGACKGWMAVCAGDARWPQYALYSTLFEFCRGYMLHEADGSRLDPAAHPSWTTWSMRTHWHHGQSPDRLGKRDLTFFEQEARTRSPYDDQHRSLNALWACYALTGNPLLGYAIDRAMATWVANVQVRNNFGSDAARAVGRRAACYANVMLLTDPKSNAWAWADLCQKDMLRQLQRDWTGGKFPGSDVDVLDVSYDPRLEIAWGGRPVPAWSVWGAGIMFAGAYALWKVTRAAGWLDVSKRTARTVVKYGTMQVDGRWVLCAAVGWVRPGTPTAEHPDQWSTPYDPALAEGAPLPAAAYSGTSTLVSVGDQGLQTWAASAVLGFVELHESADPDMARALAVAVDVCGDSDPAEPSTAEWQALVRSNPPVPGAASQYELVGA